MSLANLPYADSLPCGIALFQHHLQFVVVRSAVIYVNDVSSIQDINRLNKPLALQISQRGLAMLPRITAPIAHKNDCPLAIDWNLTWRETMRNIRTQIARLQMLQVPPGPCQEASSALERPFSHSRRRCVDFSGEKTQRSRPVVPSVVPDQGHRLRDLDCATQRIHNSNQQKWLQTLPDDNDQKFWQSFEQRLESEQTDPRFNTSN